MLPFPRNSDLEEINKKLVETRNLLTTLCSQTPQEDPNRNEMFEALMAITKAIDKLQSF